MPKSYHVCEYGTLLQIFIFPSSMEKLFELSRIDVNTEKQRQKESLLENLHPIRMFLEFAVTIGFDHSVLLDFLISSETDFLAYFTR
jgi:hypothetical protein